MATIKELPQSKARELLAEWRAREEAVTRDRPTRARIAHVSGLPITEIARLMGVARSTVYADLSGADFPAGQVTR